jgi:hypothetical protein
MQPPLDKVYGLALDVDDDPLRQYRPAAERQARYPEKPGMIFATPKSPAWYSLPKPARNPTRLGIPARTVS